MPTRTPVSSQANRRSRKQPRLDRARLRGEGRSAVVEDGDERAFADLKPEQVVQHDDEARQRDPLERA